VDQFKKKGITESQQFMYAVIGGIFAYFYQHVVDLEFFSGYDGSFRYLFSQNFETNKSFFQNQVFSIGPLMILKWPSYLGNQGLFTLIP
jgi:hypothetical protein